MTTYQLNIPSWFVFDGDTVKKEEDVPNDEHYKMLLRTITSFENKPAPTDEEVDKLFAMIRQFVTLKRK